MINEIELIEKLAELEHQQWAHWTSYFMGNINVENIARWKKQLTQDYKQLSEKEKDSDRKWANKVIKLIKEHTFKEVFKGK